MADIRDKNLPAKCRICVLKLMWGDAKMKLPKERSLHMKKAKTVTYRATLEGLTIQDIIEILALRGEELPEEVLKAIS